MDKNRSVSTINESMNTFNLTETKLSSEKNLKIEKLKKKKAQNNFYNKTKGNF